MREVARFSAIDIEFIGDILRTVYDTMTICETRFDTGDMDAKLLLGDFIVALDECDSIEIVEDSEMLIDEG